MCGVQQVFSSTLASESAGVDETFSSILPQTSSGHTGSNSHQGVIGFQMVSAESIVQSGYRNPSADTVGAVPNLHTSMPLPNSRWQLEGQSTQSQWVPVTASGTDNMYAVAHRSSVSHNTISDYGVPFMEQYNPPAAGPSPAYYNTNYYHTTPSGS